MAQCTKEVYVLKSSHDASGKYDGIIDYIYLDSKGNFQFMHSYLDNGFSLVTVNGSINKDGSLSVPKPLLAKGHYSNFKFYADSIIERS